MRWFPPFWLALAISVAWGFMPGSVCAQRAPKKKTPAPFGDREKPNPPPEALGNPWVVKEAPYRATLRQISPPNDPDAGTQIEVPDLGVVGGGNGGDYVLTDSGGHPLPVAAVWAGEGRDAILLASGLQPGQDYFLYLGAPARPAQWTPKTSLLLETRAILPRRNAFTSNGAMEEAWRGAATTTEGARFVGEIFSGGNPFGEQTNFLSHYVGYLKPQSETTEFYTSSSDASFVTVNGQPFFGWPGNHSANATLKSLYTKKLPPTKEPVRIDYYQAKNAEGDPAMCLGWIKGEKGATVPSDAWLHPGTSEIRKFEGVNGRPVPAAHVALKSYLGLGAMFLYEVQCRLLPTDLKNSPVEWRFDDGGVFTGAECTRILAGTPNVQRVTLVVGTGKEALQSVRRISFAGENPPQTDENEKGHRHYLDLLTRQDPSKLSATMLASALPVLFDVGTDEQIAPWATAWLRTNPVLTDPRWLPAELSRLRALAETDPQAALAALRNEGQARQVYGKALDAFEVELRLYSLRDAAAGARIQQIGFGLSDAREARLAAIRLGDFYRLSGDLKQAVAKYQAAQPPDPSNGRRLPAEDEANSLTVKELIEGHYRQEADEKLTEWELAHPMTKFSTDFLLLRSRVLSLYGRWRESLVELDAFASTHPDSPYQIDVDFYRARALYELGKKDEAHKIWDGIVKNYPRSELAAASKEWTAKP